VERALYHALPPLPEAEQALWTLDAAINARGFAVDVGLARAARDVAQNCRDGIDAELAKLTGDAITSASQGERIKDRLRQNGHDIESLNDRSVAAIRLQDPDEETIQLLDLREAGSQAASRKLSKLLAQVNADGRIRGTLKFHGAATGRWSGSGFQPHNLKRPTLPIPDLEKAIPAILAGNLKRLREIGEPLAVIGDLSRSLICAAPGHVLISGDFSAIESRVAAWLVGEEWKVEVYRKFDETGDSQYEPYCFLASKALRRTVTPDDEAGRQFGKTYDLAFGYAGGVGAWRKFDTSDTYNDTQIEQFKNDFRRQHPATETFWNWSDHTAKRVVKTGRPLSYLSIGFEMEGATLFMVLPSGRRIAYPQGRLAIGKFGKAQVHHRDNAKGAWSEAPAWRGTWIENAVQAIARDLLAAAMLRLEAAGFPIVLHVHDEIVCEVPEDHAGRAGEFKQLLLQLPEWAAGLPFAAKVKVGRRYGKVEGPAPEPAPPPPKAAPRPRQKGAQKAGPGKVPNPNPNRKAHGAAASAPGNARDAPTVVPLADLIGEPLDAHGNIHCPFHDDAQPSLHVYDDHYYCFGCGAHGDQINWLMQVEGLGYGEALEVLRTWTGPTVKPRNENDNDPNLTRSLELWEQARPIVGTLAERYLIEARGIDAAALPDNLVETLRFHPQCPFGPRMRHPCLIALFRDAETDAPLGIHRVALTAEGRKIDRRMLGRSPRPRAIKFWPAGARLVIGEGIETVLAAATHINHGGAPLQPAWALGSAGAIARFPVLAGVERLIILVDHDENGVGRTDARSCARRWADAGRTAVLLTPVEPGADFNDVARHHARRRA
jgi:DNA polymerase